MLAELVGYLCGVRGLLVGYLWGCLFLTALSNHQSVGYASICF